MSKYPNVDMTCPVHGETSFCTYKETKGKFTYFRHRCRKCQVDKISLLVKQRKEDLVAYKGGKCERCGYDKSIVAMQFHHLDPSKKSYTIGQKVQSYSLAKLKLEADKCIMLCANCHFEVHAESVISLRSNGV